MITVKYDNCEVGEYDSLADAKDDILLCLACGVLPDAICDTETEREFGCKWSVELVAV